MHSTHTLGEEGGAGAGAGGQIPYPITTTASTPVTPGPSTPTAGTRIVPLGHSTTLVYSPSLGHSKDNDNNFMPERPKSTPFPEQNMMEGQIPQLHPDGIDDWMADSPIAGEPTVSEGSPFSELPTEIYECILDHLFGVRSSASSRTTAPGRSKVLRSWGRIYRHSRRREVSELALVSREWRQLIQERLYRHLKIKGTRDSVDQAQAWFESHPHLCFHVKHIEIWFPVFQQKTISLHSIWVPSTITIPDRPNLLRPLAQIGTESSSSTLYQSPTDNCTLEEIFRFVSFTFANASVLTLEGGERRKPPQVRQFLNSQTTTQLPVISSIETLVCKGQWNIIRTNEDFQVISAALPNLLEWHGSYAKPKSKSYICMSTIVPKLPQNLTHLSICLENDYRKEHEVPPFFRKVTLQTHICFEMAKAIPTLEHIAYTGRICHCFFDHAAKRSDSRTSRLKTVELVVKNCCRPYQTDFRNGSGISDMAFISAFEALVLSGVRALDKLSAVAFLRVRFIDLDSQVPPLNPYFQLENNKVTGIWSDEIVDALAQTRPEAAFVEKSESLGDVDMGKDGSIITGPAFSKVRPLSIKVSNYQMFSPPGITIT